jgi:hypothetical protein
MSDRKYSVGELDQLRRAVEHKWLYGSYLPSTRGGFSRSYRDDEMTKAVEEMVRTHILAGHTAEDLYASEQQPASNDSNVEKPL